MDIFNNDEVIGWCHHHENSITLSTFEWKGCWTCWKYFESYKPLITVKDAAEKYGVSKKTIYRWIKAGRLKARLFERGRSFFTLGAVKFWAIAENQDAREKETTNYMNRKKEVRHESI